MDMNKTQAEQPTKEHQRKSHFVWLLRTSAPIYLYRLLYKDQK